MPSSILRALQILTHLIIMTTPQGKYCYCNCTDEENQFWECQPLDLASESPMSGILPQHHPPQQICSEDRTALHPLLKPGNWGDILNSSSWSSSVCNHHQDLLSCHLSVYCSILPASLFPFSPSPAHSLNSIQGESLWQCLEKTNRISHHSPQALLDPVPPLSPAFFPLKYPLQFLTGYQLEMILCSIPASAAGLYASSEQWCVSFFSGMFSAPSAVSGTLLIRGWQTAALETSTAGSLRFWSFLI